MGNQFVNKHDIVLMPFPFDDLSSGKLRPALCLTAEIGTLRHVIMAYVTSRVSPDLKPSDVVVADSHPDFAETGLDETSTVRLHRLITVRASVIVHHLGSLPVAFHAEVETKIKALFD